MAVSILPNFLTLKWNISRTIWRIEVGDGSLFRIFHALSFETKDLQTLNLKFDQVMFNSLVLMWERNFEVTFGISSVLVFQITVLESYLDVYLF